MTMADEDSIVLSDEDHAMESIEHGNTNGGNARTVNPSKLLFHTNSPEMLSPVLPFHGLGNPVKLSPVTKTPNEHDHSSNVLSGGFGQRQNFKSSSAFDSDSIDTKLIRRSLAGVRMPPPPAFAPLPYTSSRTGLVYDDRMRFHAEDENFNHPDDIHPEDPRRIYAIFHEICEAGLVQDTLDDNEELGTCDNKCWRIHIRHATKAEICLIHTPEHFVFVEGLQST